MSKWRISLYVVALFLAGAVTGSVLTYQIQRSMMMKGMRQEAMVQHWRHDLEMKLDLTPEQSEKIGGIISTNISRFRAMMKDEMQAGVSNCNTLIAAELTPEQQKKFEEVQREQQEFIRTRFKEGKPPPPP